MLYFTKVFILYLCTIWKARDAYPKGLQYIRLFFNVKD